MTHTEENSIGPDQTTLVALRELLRDILTMKVERQTIKRTIGEHTITIDTAAGQALGWADGIETPVLRLSGDRLVVSPLHFPDKLVTYRYTGGNFSDAVFNDAMKELFSI